MSNDRLALSQAALLFAYAIGMAGGQLLFKSAALRYASDAPRSVNDCWPRCQRLFFRRCRPLCHIDRCLGLDFDFHAALARLSVRGAGVRDHATAGRPVFAEPITTRLMLEIGLILGGLLLVAS